MKCCNSITCLFVTFFASVVLSAETEECGKINIFQFENSQKLTQIDEFPWMARIAYNKTKTSETVFHCQAVLISQQHLITVAHCFRDNEEVEPYAVLLGDWDTSNSFPEEDCDTVSAKCSTPLLISIDELIVHPYFSARKRKNDIGLLRLTQAVTFTDYIRPICLPDKDVKAKEFGSEELVVTGWLHKVPGHKQKMPVVVFNQHDCQRKFANYGNTNITDSVMCGIVCVGGESHLSGSALMDVKAYESVYLVGLVAYGLTRCNNRMPDVFIRVDQYLDWINENIY